MDSLPLKDIHLPAELGYWPLAWGWWCLLVVLALCLAGIWWFFRRYQHQRRFRLVADLLQAIIQDPKRNDAEKLTALSQWLRRVAISTAPREQMAGLTGLAWLEYLDRDLPERPFTQGAGRVLLAVYSPSALETIDWPALERICQHWLQRRAQQRGRHA